MNPRPPFPTELLERIAQLEDPWQHHAPLLGVDWLPHGLPLHGVHEWVLDGPIDAPPMHAILALVAAASVPGAACAASCAASCVAWIGRRILPSIVSMNRHGLDLARQVAVPGAQSPMERLWAFEEAARSGRCAVVVVDASDWSPPMVRRAQLASAWHHDRDPVLALAWRPRREANARSACTTRWLVHPVHGTPCAHSDGQPVGHDAHAPAWLIHSLRDRRGGVSMDAPALLQDRAPRACSM